MPAIHPFERSVFINCPFDKAYEPILQAIAFCVIYLGFVPRLALECNDSAALRLPRLLDLIQGSKFSIHDLSRCQSARKGEHFRLNMPFELGLDYGCREFFGQDRGEKKILILEEKPYRYQAALSDISGCDIQAHGADFQTASRKVRNWLVAEAGADGLGAARILGAYVDFQEWHYEQQLSHGFSEDDIQDYPTIELVRSMLHWKSLGSPV
ncbi:hypothetical protein [Xanthobacter autotrophicus]|uniref:hypothetical protein n=1 Tax=Xanthobacter autotrophicus TaxID=280 RepID=UPI0037295365